MSEALTRDELIDSYARPYQRWLPVALRGYGMHYLVAATMLVAAIALVGTIADTDFADTALLLALLGVGAIVW